ncbi:hypothetical protein Taro_003897 [Colocasia esculenta]|uniref:Uncharacterized protein n=1 Tax=Colocasia esculenta TaxID=4460 RepID=A0A843TQ60_COLES|nr:hypothetical protein [Colocasia esculenta]
MVLYFPHRRLWIMECSCKVWCRPCRRKPTPRLHSRLSWRLRLKYQLRTMVDLPSWKELEGQWRMKVEKEGLESEEEKKVALGAQPFLQSFQLSLVQPEIPLAWMALTHPQLALVALTAQRMALVAQLLMQARIASIP